MDKLADDRFRFGEYELDRAARSLKRAGETLSLNAKSFDLLCELVENHGRVLTKDELLERVWPGQFVEENNLSVQVSALRKVFGDKNGTTKFIATVPGKGYSFVANVEMATSGTELVIEERSISTVIVEEIVTIDQSGGVSNEIVPRLASEPQSRWKIARFVVPLAIILAALIVGYVWQTRGGAKETVPFAHFTISRLTGSGKIDSAALSPDGKLYAYSLLGTKGLWIGHTAGGEPVELRPPAEPRYRNLKFSPDSTKLYYVATGKEDPSGALYSISVFGGVPEKLRDRIRPQVSFAPGMNRYVYVSDDREKQTSSLIIADVADTTYQHELISRPLRNGFDLSTPAWSPDGSTIAVGAMTETGDNVHSEIFAVSTTDGSIKNVTNDGFRVIENIAWTSDQKGLLFTASDRAYIDNKLRHVPYPTGSVTVINPDLNNYVVALDLSASNNSLLTVSGQYLANVWIGAANNLKDAKQITFGSIGDRAGRLGLEWMPDGRLLFTATAGTGQALWTMDPDGGNRKQLTPTGFLDINPSITGDGKVVVFSSSRSGASEIWRVNNDGSDLRQVTTGGYNDMACVSPDGKWVVYVTTTDRYNLGTLFRVSIDGGEPVRLTDMPAAWARISPDGRFVAFQSLVEGKNKLVVTPIDGGEPSKIFSLSPTSNLRYALRWTPDGQTLTYRDWGNGYWRQSLAGGEPTRIEDLPEEKLFSSDWSPDGKRLAFVRGHEIRDIVLIKQESPAP